MMATPRRSEPLLRTATLFALVTGVVAGGCAEEGPRTLVLVVDSDLDVPAELDRIAVMITASRTPAGEVCEPSRRQFELDPTATVNRAGLPLHLRIEIGDEFSEWMVYLVQGLLDGAEVLRFQGRVVWPRSGARDVPVFLEAVCLETSCGDGAQCISSDCVGVPEETIFEDETRRVAGVPCDGAAELEER